MADVPIMRAVQDYSGLFWSRTSGPVLLPQSWPSRVPLGPAGGAAEGSELGYGAPSATYGFMIGPSLLGDAV